ncbi:hypothetical protein HAX54_041199 [Datura stramonium]|uniref:Retrotransposon gag domain-containing protein n=1 Tax=Datura stramonium TaxID=4076 RepID=A0ABS8SL98_DATST|nr:hypothetical protein [Datura stramonium]
MESMEMKIDRIRGLVVDLRNSSDVPPGFPESMSKSHSTALIHAVAPLTLSTSLIQNAQEGSSLYSVVLQRAFDGLAGKDKGKKREDKPSGYMAGSDQQLEMDKLVKLMKDGKRDLDFSLFDGFGDPHSHFKAYLEKLVNIGQSKNLRMKLFVRTLTGSALMWSNEILQPKNDGISNPLHKDFDPNKHCAFHSGMQGHDKYECRHIWEEIQKLMSSGRISQRSCSQLV